MQQPENKHLLSLLVKAYNQTITDYYYFPEVIYAGAQKIERSDFDLLLSEGLIRVFKYDSFGRCYRLSKKGEQQLQQQHLAKPARKKALPVPLTQGCFYFSRFKNTQAAGPRCLLFL
jgi:hypothetical protein